MNKSESIIELAKALSKAQGEMKTAKKDNTNPFFKSTYADLASVWDVCRKPLSDSGLAVSQITKNDDKGIVLETILMHSSGEWLSGEMSIFSLKNEPQAIGSAITYARRYALSAILGIAADDDDAEDAMARSDKPKPAVTTPEASSSRLITEAQIKEVYASVKDKNISNELAKGYMQARFKKDSLKRFTTQEASQFIEDIEAGKVAVPKEVQPVKSGLIAEAKKMGAVEIKEGGIDKKA